MQVVEKQSSGLIREYDITVAYSNVEEGIEKELTKLQSRLAIPGFRKGKAPISVVRKRYEAQVIPDVMEKIINKTVSDLFEKNNVQPALQPKVDLKSFDKGKDLELSVYCEIFPTFGKVNFEDITVDKYKIDLTDEELNNLIEEIRKNNRQLVEVEDKKYKLQDGDIAIIDFIGRVDGEAFDGGTANGYELKIGSKSFIDTFETQLVGHKVGEKVMVKVTFPENYHNAELANKPAEFEVDIQQIKTPGDLPEINDELPKLLNSNAKTFEEFKEKVKLAKEKEMQANAYTLSKKDLFDKLVELVGTDVPPTLLQQEIDEIKKANINEDEENLNKLARRRVILSLYLIKLAEEHKINVSQQDIRNAIFDQARQFPGLEMQVIDLYTKNDYLLNQVKNSVLEEKVVEHIMKYVKINEIATSMKELIAKLED